MEKGQAFKIEIRFGIDIIGRKYLRADTTDDSVKGEIAWRNIPSFGKEKFDKNKIVWVYMKSLLYYLCEKIAEKNEEWEPQDL